MAVRWKETPRGIQDRYGGFGAHFFRSLRCFRETRAIDGIEDPSVRDVGDGVVKRVETFPGATHFISGRDEQTKEMHFKLMDPKERVLYHFKVSGAGSSGQKTDAIHVFDSKSGKFRPVVLSRATGKEVPWD